ncbi:MAG: glycosyl hydrolase [Planctomycetes bacterium]|nr:glycosyl hydrolase [Planctomycetota bacterium]
MLIDHAITAQSLLPASQRVFQLAAEKTASLDRKWDVKFGTPVFTIEGKYSSRGWTEWTQGFQFGCLILAGDALDDHKLIELGRQRTIERMLPHVTHTGVHDHGFNNLSTYGNLLRLMNEGRIEEDAWQRTTYENAIAASGAVQAARWSPTSCGRGYIYSFNGPHSLFIDTMRTTRILGVAHQLGHSLMGENDAKINLLQRSIQHGLVTSECIVFHGDSSHSYDVRGRTAHEGTFNRNDGNFRARSTQQGYSPFSTWTRGLAWAMLGYAEELEFFKTLPPTEFRQSVGRTKREVLKEFLRCAIDTCDHYIDDVSAQDGITYWDDGAPSLHQLADWRSKPADPFNNYEPVDASASAIAAQGLIRLGNYLGPRTGMRYLQAGLTVAKTLFEEPYLSTKKSHQGLLLHSIYHWPNRWDHIPARQQIASGESSMWGDYHLLELALLIKRMADSCAYPKFFVPS